MARYPELPSLFNLKTEEVRELYLEVQRWGATLLDELDARDAIVDNRPATNMRVVVTTSEVHGPQKGDIIYAASAGVYKGYVSTAASTTFKAFY